LADKNHLAILKKGISTWNKWREENPSTYPDLSKANLREEDLSDANFWATNLYKADLIDANLSGANLSGANLVESNFSGANLNHANLSESKLIGATLIGSNLEKANLSKANLSESNLWQADLSEAILFGADLHDSNLRRAILCKADLRKSHLSGAELSDSNLNFANLTGAGLRGTKIIRTKLNGAILNDCRVFGISAWGLIGLENAEQSNLVITPADEPVITVDNLEFAQFIYILLHSEKIRGVIDTLTSKVVLILGRFTPERKAVLDTIRDELRKRNYLPVLFDFDKPASRNITETVSTLAHMARFVIADITDARSIPQELERIVPRLTSVPVKPILLSSADEYGMFEDFKPYNWVLEIHRYNDLSDLLKSLGEKVIAPAEEKAKELQKR
jgi:uncharacterized protein YjbI with pentapeptide repeats